MPCVWLLLLCLGSASWASESGSFGYKAKQLYQSGRYAESLRQLQKALGATAKEGDLRAEALIRIDMAQILLHLYAFSAADSLLLQIDTRELDYNGKLAWLYTRQRLLNQQNLFSQSAQVYRQFSPETPKKAPKLPRALCLMEYAIASAGSGKPEEAQQALDQAANLLDEEASGQLRWTHGRIAHLSHRYSDAIAHYTAALRHAQSSHKYWHTGQILLALAALHREQSDIRQAVHYYSRAARLYREMGLDRPFLAAAEPLSQLSPDAELDAHIAAARLRLGSPQVTP